MCKSLCISSEVNFCLRICHSISCLSVDLSGSNFACLFSWYVHFLMVAVYLSFCQFVCLSISLSASWFQVCLSLSLSERLLSCLPACQPISLPAYQPDGLQPASLSACRPISLPAYQPVGLSACQPMSLPAYQPASLSACRPISLPAYQHASLAACQPNSLPA